MPKRCKRQLTPEEIKERGDRLKKERVVSLKIIERIQKSLRDVVPKKSCSNCKYGESRHGGWTSSYQGTWCTLLYSHISKTTSSKKAFEAQVTGKNKVCALHEA